MHLDKQSVPHTSHSAAVATHTRRTLEAAEVKLTEAQVLAAQISDDHLLCNPSLRQVLAAFHKQTFDYVILLCVNDKRVPCVSMAKAQGARAWSLC